MKTNFTNIKKKALRISVRKKRKTKWERAVTIKSIALHNRLDQTASHRNETVFIIRDELYK